MATRTFLRAYRWLRNLLSETTLHFRKRPRENIGRVGCCDLPEEPEALKRPRLTDIRPRELPRFTRRHESAVKPSRTMNTKRTTSPMTERRRVNWLKRRDWALKSKARFLPTVDDYIKKYDSAEKKARIDMESRTPPNNMKGPEHELKQKEQARSSVSQDLTVEEVGESSQMAAARSGLFTRKLFKAKSTSVDKKVLNGKHKRVLDEAKRLIERADQMKAEEAATTSCIASNLTLSNDPSSTTAGALEWQSYPRFESLGPLPTQPLPRQYNLTPHTLELLERHDCLHKEIENLELSSAGVPAYLPSMLDDEDRKRLTSLLSKTADTVLFTVDNCDFTYRDVTTLPPGKWLNDNIINGYMKLLQLRDGQVKDGLSCHFSKTFLINHIFPNYTYKNVERWTTEKRLKKWGQQKNCILECDLVFFPVNLNQTHWVLVVADLKNKIIRYYDSLGAGKSVQNAEVNALLSNIRSYIIDESKHKQGVDLNEDSFRLEVVQNMPQQVNFCDCGVYVTRTAKELSGGNTLAYTPEEMTDYRHLILKELSNGQLL